MVVLSSWRSGAPSRITRRHPLFYTRRRVLATRKEAMVALRNIEDRFNCCLKSKYPPPRRVEPEASTITKKSRLDNDGNNYFGKARNS